MKQVCLAFVLSGVVLTSGLSAATNPFAEESVTVNQSASSVITTSDSIARANEAVNMENIEDSRQKLKEANENFSRLIREFSSNPAKYADDNGDYREFVRKLIELSQRLERLSKDLERVAASQRPAEPAPAAASTIAGTVRVGTSLNIRSSPWGTITGRLRDNDRVEITGESGDWYKINHNGQTAYVHKNYVETAERRAGITPVVPQAPASGNAPSAAANAAPATASGGGLTAAPCQPMPSRVSSPYGWRIHPTLGTRRFHDGIDLPIPNGTRLNALGNGTVTDVGYESGGGKFIKVRYDNGYESFYCHLQSASVARGQRVNAGQEIARSDNTGQWTTGPHLHFGLKRNGQSVDPRAAGVPLP